MYTALMIIKPFTVSRDDAGGVLQDTLDHSSLLLARFRQWVICPTTLKAVTGIDENNPYPLVMKRPSWICLFTTVSFNTHPFDILHELWGVRGDLRGKWKNGIHPLDTVVRLTDKDRVKLEEDLLF